MDTPFTVVVSLPDHDHAGNYRVHATEEIHRSHAKGTHFILANYLTATKASNNTILLDYLHLY